MWSLREKKKVNSEGVGPCEVPKENSEARDPYEVLEEKTKVNSITMTSNYYIVYI